MDSPRSPTLTVDTQSESLFTKKQNQPVSISAAYSDDDYTEVIAATESIKHNLGNIVDKVKYKFDASYLFYEREKNEIFSEAFLSEYKIHIPQIIIIN
jgi:hypothetical protein